MKKIIKLVIIITVLILSFNILSFGNSMELKKIYFYENDNMEVHYSSDSKIFRNDFVQIIYDVSLLRNKTNGFGTVYMRISFDDWESYKDFPLKKLHSTYTGSSYFGELTAEFKIPSNSKKVSLAFYIIDVHNGKIFWDNNNGNNYSFLTRNVNGYLPTEEEEKKLFNKIKNNC